MSSTTSRISSLRAASVCNSSSAFFASNCRYVDMCLSFHLPVAATVAFGNIIIVAFTAQDEAGSQKGGIAAGFDAYCQKGGTPDSLLHLLAQIGRQGGI
ncbi:hypothetical protein [Paraburkholderia tropica]|uniref:hypothetical protein n=1 Tax=Paraburkholderia tropica TaxID=92647 RepID=UPI002AAF2195|nr:hypothetical protein [Paraburkholderia tropica]